MRGLIFEKLEEVKCLKSVNSRHATDYKNTPDYHKIAQIIEQYVAKYSKDFANVKKVSQPLTAFKDELTHTIVDMYERVQAQEASSHWKDEVIVLDYLVTLRQLVGLLQANDMEGFHCKSKI